MASKKNHSEGIALLSVYSDEDDEEMEDAEQRNQEEDSNLMDEERGRGDDSTTLDNGASAAHATPRSLDNREPDETSGESTDTDTLLDQFLPQPPRDNCSEELQRKIDKFLSLKKIGKSFNNEVRNRKEYRNPDFLLHAVSYQDIDQTGSSFIKHVFDPNGYDPSDALEVDMKHERERKEQESKMNQKLDFVVSAGAQPGMVFASQKPNIPIAGVPALATSGLPSIPTEIAARDGRPNKKSKWDKVDGDVKNPHPPAAGIQDSVSSIRSSSTLPSGLSADSGYLAFANQRRLEVEGRRSAERKLERS